MNERSPSLSFEKLDATEKERVNWFFENLGRSKGLIFDPSDVRAHQHFLTVRNHISKLLLNERNQVIPNAFVLNCSPKSYMCDVLITSGITDLEPKEGVVFCTCVVGARISGIATGFYNTGSEKSMYRKEHLDLFFEPFTRRLYKGNDPISTVVSPINLDNNHWGLLVARRYINPLKKSEERTVSFGDSLGSKCPPCILSFFKAAIDHVFPHCRVKWKASRTNLLLHDLNFTKQQDGYSCGAYVLAGFSTFAASTGFLPKRTYASGYDPDLTEDYRWMAKKVRVLNIIRAAEEKGMCEIDEAEVSIYQHRNRELWLHDRQSTDFILGSEPRNVLQSDKVKLREDEEGRPMQSISYIIDQAFAQLDKNLEAEEERFTKSKDRASYIAQKLCSIRADTCSWYSTNQLECSLKFKQRRKLRFCDSFTVSTRVVHELINAAVEASCKRVRTNPAMNGSQKRAVNLQLKSPVGCSGEVRDLPKFLYDLCLSGEHFGVHRLQKISKKWVQENNIISGRLRCIKYKPPTSCRCAIVVRLKPSSRTWTTSRVSEHTHAPIQASSAACLERYKSALKSLKGRMRDWKADNSFCRVWEELERTLIPFYDREECKGELSRLNHMESMRGHSKPNDGLCTHLSTNSKYVTGPILCAADYIHGSSCINGSFDDESNAPGLVRSSPISETAIPTNENSEATTLDCSEGLNVSLAPSKICKPTTAVYNEINVNGCAEEEDMSLIQSFIDEAEAPMQSLLMADNMDSVSRQIIDTFEEDDDMGGQNSDSSKESGASQQHEENLFTEAVHAYVSSVKDNAPGLAVIDEVKFIAECFGHGLITRCSRYHKHIPVCEEENFSGLAHKWVLHRAIIKCEKSSTDLKCPFTCHIRTRDGISGYKNDDSIVKSYDCRVTVSHHNHSPNLTKVVNHLPPKLQAEAFDLRNEFHIPFADIVRLLETKYNIVLNRKGLSNKLNYARGIQVPREHECMHLCRELLRIKEKDPKHRVFMTISDDGRMDSAAWAFAEWLDDYEKYGVVPGVSIDCKVISNRFGLPLFTVNGRSNDGFVLTFFMAFMSNETEVCFERVLCQFKSTIRISPAMIAMDQCVPCINATRNVFNTSYPSLDEWHLNQNQLKNCGTWCSKIGRKDLVKQMCTDLFTLRKATTEESFISLRANLEMKYFYSFQEDPPSWFNFLYHRNPDMLVAFFRNQAVPYRYLFQGTGYTECSNSSYRRYIMQRRVPLHKIPNEMARVANMSNQRRSLARSRSLKLQSPTHRKIANCQLPVPPTVMKDLMTEYTAYSLLRFVDLSVEPSKNYVVERAEVVTQGGHSWPDSRVPDEAILEEVAVFQVHSTRTGDIDERKIAEGISTYQVYMTRHQGSEDHAHTLIAACSCRQHSITGFPCRHIVRCTVTYSEMLLREPNLANVLGNRIPIELFFDRYWKYYSEDHRTSYVPELRKKIAREQSENLRKSQSNVVGESRDQTAEAEGIVYKEVQDYLSWSDARAMTDQIHRLASSLGPVALQGMRASLEDIITSLSRGRAPMPSLQSSVRLTSEVRDVFSLDGEARDALIKTVQNPNPGYTRYQKRKKTFLERTKTKRYRRNTTSNIGSLSASLNVFSSQSVDMTSSKMRSLVNTAIDTCLVSVDQNSKRDK